MKLQQQESKCYSRHEADTSSLAHSELFAKREKINKVYVHLCMCAQYTLKVDPFRIYNTSPIT